MHLAEIFEPLYYLVINDPPDNLCKIYELLWVKINDIGALSLDKDAASTQFQENPTPSPSLFESKEAGQQKVNVDYFCSLIKVSRWELLNCILASFKPVYIDQKSATTQYVKRHADVMFSKMRYWIMFHGFLQLIFTALISIHVMHWDDGDYNDIVIPCLFAIDIIFLLSTPTTFFIIATIIAPILYWAKKITKWQTGVIYSGLYSYFTDPWRFCHTFLQYIMFIYLILYIQDQDDDSGPKLLAISVFLAYMRLISYLRLMKGPRKLVSTIIYVAKKSVAFYIILMIYIIACAFGIMALRQEDEFRPHFQIAYRGAFADWEDDYDTRTELIQFLITSFFGPLLLLNLLIAIMGDAHAACQENWEVEEIREKYAWAQEVCGMIWSVVMLTLPCGGKKYLDKIFGDTGFIHYCIPVSTVDEEDDDEDQWAGQVNKIERHITRSEKRILSAVLNNSGSSSEMVWSDTAQKPSEGSNDVAGSQLTRRIEAIERKNAERYEALERNNAQLRAALERQNSERQAVLEGKIKDLEAMMDGKMNQVLEILRARS